MKLIKLYFLSFLSVILTACGGGSGIPNQDNGTDVTEPTIISLQITPENSRVPVGFSQQFIATAILSDGTTKDVTNNSSLVWTTDDNTVATIISHQSSGNGLATGITPGIVTITASTGLANGTLLNSTAQLEVTNPTVVGLQVSPFNLNVPAGLSRAYKATAFFSDGSSRDVTTDPALTWSSVDTNIASINDDTGVATGIIPGKTTIIASGNVRDISFKASTLITVTNAVVNNLAISPYNRNVPIGLQKQFTAMVQLSDGTSLDVTADPALNWSSNNTKIATINANSGMASGISKGSVTITAFGHANGKNFSATTPLTVSDAIITDISLTPNYSAILAGETQQYTAIGQFSDGSTDTLIDATWYISNPTSARIDASGLATGTGIGSSYVFAYKNGITSDEATLDTAASNVVAWGDASLGGDVTPIQPELHNVKTIYSNLYGWAFAALRIDGSVVTWGMDSLGGDSGSVQSELHDVISIASTDSAFAALRADGSVVTWGESGRGGDSSSITPELHNVVSITSAEMAFAALRDNGTVVTWGASNGGGDSSPCASELYDIEYMVSGVFDIAAYRKDGYAISWGGHNHNPSTCRISAAPVAKIFGGKITNSTADTTNNGIFYLGYDGVLVSDELDSPLSNVKTVATTNYNYAVIHNDGSVTTNLDNSSVQSELYNIDSILGNDKAFAAIRADGHVFTWGDPMLGGDSSAVSTELHDVVSLSATANSFAALRRDGTVVMWGDIKNESSGVRPIKNVRSLTGAYDAYAATIMVPTPH